MVLNCEKDGGVDCLNPYLLHESDSSYYYKLYNILNELQIIPTFTFLFFYLKCHSLLGSLFPWCLFLMQMLEEAVGDC